MNVLEEGELEQLRTAGIQNGFTVEKLVWSDTYEMFVPKKVLKHERK